MSFPGVQFYEDVKVKGEGGCEGGKARSAHRKRPNFECAEQKCSGGFRHQQRWCMDVWRHAAGVPVP